MENKDKSCIKPQQKIERIRQKLASLEGYFKKTPGHYIWNRDEAFTYMCQALRYLLFLIEEYGIKDFINKENSKKRWGKND